MYLSVSEMAMVSFTPTVWWLIFLIHDYSFWLSFKYYIKGGTIGIVLPNLPTSNEEGNAGTNIPNLPSSKSQEDSVIKNNEDFEDEPSSDANEVLINKGMFNSFRCLFHYIIFLTWSLIIFILFWILK